MKHGLNIEEANWTGLFDTEYLRTTSCPRCAGLLVNDWFYDLENSGEYHVKVLRCVQCGNRIDPTSDQRRIRPPVLDELEDGVRTNTQ
jgi:hypothetical protein